MTDQLSGQLDLRRFFDPSTSHDLVSTLELRGATTARNTHAVCAVIGSPNFDDQDASNVSRMSGKAAGVLGLWQKHGTAMPSHLRGSFAVAIADSDRKSVFLAVDRFSIQSLCYRIEDNMLSFSDRADCVAGRGDDLDPQAIFDFLYFHVIPAPRTIFSKVRRLPAAHAVLIDQSGTKQFRHWAAEFDEQHREPFGTAKDRFLEIVRDAVAEQMDGEPRVGAFLSGGTDSSTVAGMICKITEAPARAYSIGFAAEDYDEMDYARLAARHFGCDHHEYYVTSSDILTALPAIARHYDQPFGNSSALPAYFCAKMAKADGCSKMLAGDGGDELFGGNARYATQQLFEVYQGLPHGLRRMIEPMCGDGSPLRRLPGLRQAAGYVRHSCIPMPDRMQSFNLVMHLDPAKILTDALYSRIDTREPRNHMRDTWNDCHAKGLINRMLAFDWRYTLADCDLPKVQGATALAGIAVGYPLLADRLVDFSMSLQPEWKVHRFKLRWFFKEALRGFLPEAIIAKKKKGFGLPFGVWAATDPALKHQAEESLYSLAKRGVIREDFARHLLADYLPDHPRYYGEMVWILVILEQWLDQFVPNYSLNT